MGLRSDFTPPTDLFTFLSTALNWIETSFLNTSGPSSRPASRAHSAGLVLRMEWVARSDLEIAAQGEETRRLLQTSLETGCGEPSSQSADSLRGASKSSAQRPGGSAGSSQLSASGAATGPGGAAAKRWGVYQAGSNSSAGPGLSPALLDSRPGPPIAPGIAFALPAPCGEPGVRKSPEELCPRLTLPGPSLLGPGPPRASPLLSTNPLSTGSAGTRWNLTRPHKWRRTCQERVRLGSPDVKASPSAASAESPDHPGNASGRRGGERRHSEPRP